MASSAVAPRFQFKTDFFSADELELRRNVWYRDQRNAAALVVHSQQTRQDAIQYLGIPEERVFYAPYGPLDTYPEPDQATLRKVTDELNLPERFVFYPAYTWPHKNHLALVEAIYSLKKRDIEVNVVFTVVDGAYGEILKQEIVSRDLGRQVTIVGRVSPEKMGVLYRQSAFVVVPSLFEQNSGPVLEAIHFGKAVAVSNIKEVELTLAGAGLLFDPHSVQQIADAIDQLWSSSAALAEAEASIQRRNAEMSWEPFRRVYRQAYAYALGR